MQEKDKIFIGMYREDFNAINKRTSGAYVRCDCGHICQTTQSLFVHWQLGHFDTPVYKDWEEVVRARNKTQPRDSD